MIAFIGGYSVVQNTPAAWTLTRLQAALSAEELANDFHVNRIEQAEPVLQITMRAQGDLNIRRSNHCLHAALAR
jgi:uncharacterized protein YjfI (DUF2170 family)